MIKKTILPLVMGAALVLTTPQAFSGELVYRPNNPSFGGDPLRGTYLLNKAQAQDTNRDPNAPDFRGFSEADLFIQDLRAGILNDAIQDALAGDGNAVRTVITSSTLDISLTPRGTGFVLNIFDKTTGEDTIIEFGPR